MRISSILTALLVMMTLYLLVFEREAVIAFAQGSSAEEGDAPQQDVVAANAVSVWRWPRRPK